MFKPVLFLSGIATLVVTCLVAPAAAPSDPYLEILTLESKRSLGDGELARLLGSSDARVAARAALAVGRTKQAAGEPLVAAHLSDPRVAVRAFSVYAVGLLGTGAQAGPIVEALGDPAGAVRVAAADAVARYEAAGRFGAAEVAAQQALERALASDDAPIVRARAATALVEFHAGPRVAEAATALVAAYRTDRDPSVRWHAMWSIYRGFALAAGTAAIEPALRDRDPLVRIEAVRAISRFKDAALAAVVRPLLADRSWRVQEQASETLRALEGKPPSEHWTAIPAFVHLPAVQTDPLRTLPELPAGGATGSGPPLPGEAILAPVLDPATAADMTSPAAGPHPRVRIVTTKGNLYVTLFPEWAPLTVANFLNLARRGYYDGNRWFRIVPDFVVQTGDPNGNGNGDAGYTLGAEENPLEQRSYVISMGLNYDDKTQTPIRDSAGTQYYVTLSPQLHLDRDFTVFGDVTGGFDVLAHLVERDRVLRVDRIEDATVKIPASSRAAASPGPD